MAVIVVIVDFSIQRLLSKHFKNWNVERWWWTQNTDNKRAKTKDIRIHTIYSVLLRTTLNIYCNAAASEQKCTHCTKRQQQQQKTEIKSQNLDLDVCFDLQCRSLLYAVLFIYSVHIQFSLSSQRKSI